jgi:UDP-glucose 4-epimerase
MKVLVSGGAGYIGSHTVVRLVEAGHDVVVVDNFSNAVPAVLGRLEALTGTSIPNHAFDLVDHDKTAHLFESEDFDAVIHFAGYKAVGESVAKPLDYYENNLGSTFSLLRAMERHDVHKLVFSSSATVYGTDQAGATEDRRTFATNPYGWSCATSPSPRRRCASRCCATSTRSGPTPPGRSARTPPARPTT